MKECPDELKKVYELIRQSREALLDLERKMTESKNHNIFIRDGFAVCPGCGKVGTIQEFGSDFKNAQEILDDAQRHGYLWQYRFIMHLYEHLNIRVKDIARGWLQYMPNDDHPSIYFNDFDREIDRLFALGKFERGKHEGS